MKKPYDKYVTKSSFATIIGIVFMIIATSIDDKFNSTVIILIGFLYLGMAFYCLNKERKEGE